MEPPEGLEIPEGREWCFCCGDVLSSRQVARHLKILLGDMLNDLEAGPGLDNNLAANDEAPAPALEGEMDEGFDDDDLYIDENVDLDPNGALPPPLPPLPRLSPPLLFDPAPRHEVRQNLPVGINDWPEPVPDDNSNHEVPDIANNEDPDGPNRDPPFIEEHEPVEPDFNPLREPMIPDHEIRAMLEAQLGELADQELLELYHGGFTARDERSFRFLATRLRTHFSRQTYDDLRFGVCEPLDLPSEFVAWRRLRILSGLESRTYDCCLNSCICYLGKYQALEVCPFCREPRYNARGVARRLFSYTPVIPQLQAMFRSAEMIDKLQYRARCDAEAAEAVEAGEPELVQDVFDGEVYRRLRHTPLHGEYNFFDNPEDIALGLATDGFTLFKRIRRGLSTAWPIILINYNLHPRYRTKLENVICVGVIPGPFQCKDLNSFLVPIVDELLLLERGVNSTKVSPVGVDERRVNFILRAFLIMIIGDMPAVAKLLALRGHNAIRPCRTCYIRATRCEENSTYYVPLRPPDAAAIPANLLPMRTHAFFLYHYDQLEALVGAGRREQFAKDLGINSRPLFAHLKSFDLATCAPYDLMHLIFENLVPNMIEHWIGEFYFVDQGAETYELDEDAWVRVGKLTTEAARTIPSAFVGTLPDIARDRHLYKAEAFSFWFQYIAPVVLKDRLPRKYYEHYLLMREILTWVLQFDLRRDRLDELERMVFKWVNDYEKFYYQYKSKRLPTCPLTIHALLHMPYYIKMTGPLWASWAFVMERVCGHLKPVVTNRSQPYVQLDNYITRRAQIQSVSHKFGLPMLPRSTVKWTFQGRERLSTHERMYPEFPEVILGVPVNRCPQPDQQLLNQISKYFGTVYDIDHQADILERVDFATMVRFGRLRLAGDGDKIRTASALSQDKDGRDNSYIRYELLPDRNARFRRRRYQPFRQVNYGQLLDIYYVKFIEDFEGNVVVPYLLARVQTCQTGGLDAAVAENPSVTYTEISSPDIIHANTITYVIGRVQLDETKWAIIDRSRDGVRPEFVNDDGDVEDLN